MKTLVANWKSHPDTLDQARELFTAEATVAAKYPAVQTIICPPLDFLSELSAISHSPSAVLGAQDVFWKIGEEHPDISYVLVGHSDRRYPPAGGGDTDEIVNQKLLIALESGVTPILLVGERERGADRQVILEKQLTLDLAGLSAEMLEKVLICYEPVWAISTNPGAVADTPDSALAAIGIISNFLTNHYSLSTSRYLYGGSVNPANITSFLRHPEISGAVIGRASLDSEQFGEVLRLVAELV